MLLRLIPLLLSVFSYIAIADSPANNTQADVTPAPIHAGITPSTGIAQNKSTDFTLHLQRQKNNQPVTPDDLQVMHTKIVHLLIIDPSLTDFHHVHPQPAKIPGTYSFAITPQKAGEYKAYVDITPKDTGETVYLPIFLDVTGEASSVTPNPEVKAGKLQESQEVNGLLFTAKVDTDSIKTQQNYEINIQISDAKTKKPFTDLEPIMGAFAHMVGFNADRSEVVHVHPMGAEPTADSQRGGPDLNFHVSFPTAGFYRLFAQVQVAGKFIFVPLDVWVEK